VYHRTLADATDLHRWADRLEARSRLPELLRRLILATPLGIDRVSFPAGEGIQLGGWDGVLVARSASPFVPEGYSVWEFGVNSKVKAKADEDYRKRTDEPLGLRQSDTTYIFVTPRRWSRKEGWVAERQAEGTWKEVRAYDADDLEQWLHQAPAVHLWLSVITGKHPQTAVDLEHFWEEWSEVTRPPLSPSLLISGREEPVQRLQDWLSSGVSSLTIKADTRDEVVAFLAAVIDHMPAEERLSQFSRTIVVTDQLSWNHLVASNAGLILIPTFDIRGGTTRATRAGHHVLIPRGRDDSENETTVKLSRIRHAHAREAFRVMGVAEERLDNLARLAHRSLMALRRRLVINEELQQPAWAKPAEARSLVSALLAGGWSDVELGDREIVVRLSRQEYDQVSATLVRWANEPDPPVRRVGNTWMLSAKEDAWPLLTRFLTRDDLELFESVVLDVLGTPDPRFELPTEQRSIAGILGKTPAHSGLLCTGLVDTIALMGAYSDTPQFADALSGQERANRIVRALLTRGNEDWRIWASLAHHLPRLAEAAPSEFLSSAERVLLTDPPVLLQLFEDSQSTPLFGSSAHTGLLWALELLAWHPDYLGRAALLLARLAAREPGGKLMNRPGNSLREIFLCWHPQTTATLQQRLDVLDLLRQREPSVMWGVLCQILPGQHSVSLRTSVPQWRDWMPDPLPTITYAEVYEAAESVVARLLSDVGDNPHRWKVLIEMIDDVPQQARENILRHLMAADRATFSEEARLAIREALRSLVSKHRAFPEARWVLPDDVLERLDTACARYEPESPVEQHAWLFSSQPIHVAPFGENWEARYQAISETRLRAAEQVYSHSGLEALLNFAAIVDEPVELGRTLGTSDLLAAEEDLFLLEASGVVPEERLAKLEWLCLPALEREERGPRILHREMARNPAFFIELLSFVYRASNEEPKELTPDEHLRNRRAYELLQSWRDMPGRRADGSIEAEALERWVTEVRTAVRAVERLAVADTAIGEVLSRSPKDSDGSWPSAAVRNIIDAIGSEELEDGFMVGAFNSRGVFIKAIGEGGAQERELAATYRGYAELVPARWPRTAAMLNLFAEQYLAHAREADIRAELEEDLRW